jgi:transcription antitermination protein NusB
MDKESIQGKRRARKLALQALYQWHMSGTELTEIDAQCRAFHNMERVDSAYFLDLLYGVPKHLTVLEAAFAPFLDRPVHELNPIELTVLRLGAFELMHRLEIPYRVILDESITLTKEFGSQDGHRYVNGVLHQLAQQTRAVEISLGHG